MNIIRTLLHDVTPAAGIGMGNYPQIALLQVGEPLKYIHIDIHNVYTLRQRNQAPSCFFFPFVCWNQTRHVTASEKRRKKD